MQNEAWIVRIMEQKWCRQNGCIWMNKLHLLCKYSHLPSKWIEYVCHSSSTNANAHVYGYQKAGVSLQRWVARQVEYSLCTSNVWKRWIELIPLAILIINNSEWWCLGKTTCSQPVMLASFQSQYTWFLKSWLLHGAISSISSNFSIVLG